MRLVYRGLGAASALLAAAAVSPARATPVLSLEAFVSGSAVKSALGPTDGSFVNLTLSNYGASGSAVAYNASITATGYDFSNGGVADVSLAAQLSAPKYTSSQTPLPLTIELTETGLSGNQAYQFASAFTAIFVRHANNLTYSAYADATNAAFGTGTLLYTNSVTGPGSFNLGGSLNTSMSGLFSFTEVFVFTPVASVLNNAISPTLDGTISVSAMPEPTGLAAFGAALLGLVLLRMPRATRRAGQFMGA